MAKRTQGKSVSGNSRLSGTTANVSSGRKRTAVKSLQERAVSAADETVNSVKRATPASIKERMNDPRLKEIVRRITSGPIPLYLAGGAGTLLLARFALKYYRRHPEFSEYIRENFHTVESKLREYRDSYRSEDSGEEFEARH